MFQDNCSDCCSFALIALAVWSIAVNILLYFPNGDSTYASANQLTNYVWYFEGICFGGIMILIIASILLLVNKYTCCPCCCPQTRTYDIKYTRLGSMIFALLGLVFSGYSLIISALALAQGPYCKLIDGTWNYPFQNTGGGYLVAYSSWAQCTEPTYVVEWNVILFSLLIMLGALEVIICSIKVLYDLKIILSASHCIIPQETALWAPTKSGLV
ncbi:hypothetical protein XENTR_v10014668 [Xenopus tropicalis]|uniref:Transmembrane 4 L six family member 18 n=1 Tax=Xenopus tropicalis TaxID=8364 RepID=A0A6I8SK37_XENTR|nr:transmembrane 4 L6 family member 18 [Xenopus tropicalis]KAE8604330.1 hypothetical protein XENTR_v10014668 [Xenopus tropicalis]|eukprot:XP_002937374.1 PREDICTED: transmembrane 4 L6 family member 18 [Xenopus tropicalis]